MSTFLLHTAHIRQVQFLGPSVVLGSAPASRAAFTWSSCPERHRFPQPPHHTIQPQKPSLTHPHVARVAQAEKPHKIASHNSINNNSSNPKLILRLSPSQQVNLKGNRSDPLTTSISSSSKWQRCAHQTLNGYSPLRLYLYPQFPILASSCCPQTIRISLSLSPSFPLFPHPSFSPDEDLRTDQKFASSIFICCKYSSTYIYNFFFLSRFFSKFFSLIFFSSLFVFLFLSFFS